MKQISLLSPAKINLFLHILGKRPDGYHELQSAIQFLDYNDEIHLALREDGKITIDCNVPELISSDNLAIKAAHFLQHFCGPDWGVHITLNKYIPMGAGLGGGSSNAATTLLGLNQLWDLNLSYSQLKHLGSELGADVPVFLQGQAAWVEGIGERLTPLDLPERYTLVISPTCHVSTATVFQHPTLTRNTPAYDTREYKVGMGHNDCEKVVRTAYPAVDEAMHILADMAEARLTGTGAGVFAQFATEPEALAVKMQLPSHFKAFIAKSLNISPLKTSIQEKSRYNMTV